MEKMDSTLVYPWGDSRRFNSYANFIKRTFGGRVQKLSINAGFSCPNRDGTVGLGGCTYCNNSSFTPSYCLPSEPIHQQITKGIAFHAHRYRRAKFFMAYFQAYSNTYGSLERLKEVYEQALSVDGVVGLVIGTRPDCVDSEKLDLLASLSNKHYVSLEFGVESCDNRILNDIERGHTYEQAVWAIEQAAKRGLNVGGHFILGFPNQTEDDIISQIGTINQLPLSSIKFHQLQIVRDTKMASQFEANPQLFRFFSPSEYLDLMVRVIERLNPKFVVERISGEASPKTLLAPKWDIRADHILTLFENMLEEKATWQGRAIS